MLFNSLIFLFFFLPITYSVYWWLRTKNQRYLWLTITGYVFYAFWNYKFCAVMLFSTVVSYAAGRGFLIWNDRHRRRLCLLAPILIDLSLLAFFKYTGWLLSTTSNIATYFSLPIHPPRFSIVLPIGISFYTFHTISYIVDSYRRTITPTRNFFEFSCYVSLFSQLVAGPIVRYGQIERDLEQIDHKDRTSTLSIGWSFFALGLIKKVIIADTIAMMIDPALINYQHLSTISTWLCMLGYTYQLYFDFSGYSDMAVGLGYFFGIHIPQNFNSPYKATDIADFWSRWHISLSTCLRDYIYIPLGIRGPRWKLYRNILITMLIGGIWHGANWTFLLWGAYHGVLLVAYRLFQRQWDSLPKGFRRLTTFLLVVLGWVVFRSANIGMAISLLAKMFHLQGGASITTLLSLVVIIFIAGGIAHLCPNTFELRHRWSPVSACAISVLFAACLFLLYGGQASPFLYFQF